MVKPLHKIALRSSHVNRLPEKYRAALVLCVLESRTYAEAARHLDCALGTLKSRLAWARDRLRRRLIRRGLAPATATLAADLAAGSASAAVPAGLARTTVEAAVRCLTGRAAVGVDSPSASTTVSLLTEGVLSSRSAENRYGRRSLQTL